jgi:putative IMPACT (imprinted ancient) family translation regulator
VSEDVAVVLVRKYDGKALGRNRRCHQFQRSINKTCCSSEDKFITEDTMAKVLHFIQKVCLHINKFVYARSRKCERKIGIVN